MGLLTFNADGTIDVSLLDANGNDLPVRLRRPDVEEFFGLWASIDRLIAEQQRAIADRGEPPADLVDDASETARQVHADAVAAYAAKSRETTRSMLRMNANFLTETISLLAPGGIPEGARLPSTATQSTLPGLLLAHWQEAPLVPGSPTAAPTE